MAVSYIEIDTDQLKRDTQELIGSRRNAEAALNEMIQEIEELNAMWSGRANDAFRTQFANDVTMMNELLDKMKALAECMEFAAREYIKCEGEVKSMVDNIRI